MPKPRVRQVDAGTDDVRDMWECRYFVSEPPLRFTHKEIQKVFACGDSLHSIENDVYFIVSDTAVNIKVRKLEKKPIKVKVMLERKDDDFERWRTEINSELPAPAEVWKEVLARLEVEADIQFLSKCSHPGQVIDALVNACSNLTCVETRKRRMLYKTPAARVEVVKVIIGTRVLYSVSFESPNLTHARAIHKKLSADDLGTPKSYVSFLSQISG